MVSGNFDKIAAINEINKTLKLCDFCTKNIGLSFLQGSDKKLLGTVWRNAWFSFSAMVLLLMVAGEINYVLEKLIKSSSVVEFVSGVHIAGYDTMSFGKLLTIWYKKEAFKHLLIELADIWPMSAHDKEATEIKRKKISRLRSGQFLYAFWNILGLWLYNLTPIAVYLYRRVKGMPAYLDYIWHLSYPFDKTQPVYHEIVFVFELYGGVVSVWSMLGSDILFMTMSSHISMLLQLLQLKIRRLSFQTDKSHYQDIVAVVKIHQKLIKYGNDLEEAFSLVNLINVLLSSVNICCVVFNILLDPWMAMSNKFFLGAALTQVGILCWYADDICTSSAGVADAVYESGWYNSDIRCRQALLTLIQRSQKPLYFTAMKFSSITMKTYSSILTTSYSYFALLYTVYRSN
ncbi:odorant receptor 4-like [Zerene cesonia]|uniref:odorant receptor 4-like n=1 Tax=Zerene cesonia TaxID=33412 RepID=UPI0018E4E3CF|nr:odorant receptor 4-like [Zerene cesonia]